MKNLELLPRKTLTVLLVEDDDGDAFLIEEMLNQANANQDPAGRTGLLRAHRLSDCTPLLFADADVVLLDLNLPDSRGLDTLRALRHMAPDLPVVVLSGLDDESLALDAVRQGAQDYLTKGQVGLKMLYRVIRYAIERTQSDKQMDKLHSLEAEMAERLRTEDALRKSERQLAKAQRIAAVGSWEWDIPSNHLSWSGETFRIFGIRDSEFDGTYEGFLKFLHPEDRDRMHASVARAYETGQPFDLQHRIVRPDGTIRHLRARGEPVTDDDGHVIRMLGTSQDVTEITTAIEAARQQNALIALLQKVSSAANKAASPSEALAVCLPETRRLTGWELAVARVFDSGASAFISVDEDFEAARPFVLALQSEPGESALVQRVLSSGKPQWSFDLRGEAFAGKDAALAAGFTSSFAFPILIGSTAAGVIEYFTRSAMAPSGTLIEVMAQIGVQIGRVVERVKADDDIRRAHADLETRVQERTRELSRAVQDLRRSNADLEQFAFVASHDLTEPLRRINAFGDLLKDQSRDWADARAKDFVTRMQESAQRMSKLIEHLLQYSRVSPTPAPLEPFPLEHALREAAATVAPALESAEMVIGKLPEVSANRSQMRELFKHLLDNAAKFRADRPLRVEIGARRESGAWAVWVRDNGIGIEPEFHEKVFAIFRRLHSRNSYAGNGIGLAICKKIIEVHGGRIWIESDGMAGTGIFFSLPDSAAPEPRPRETVKEIGRG